MVVTRNRRKFHAFQTHPRAGLLQHMHKMLCGAPESPIMETWRVSRAWFWGAQVCSGFRRHAASRSPLQTSKETQQDSPRSKTAAALQRAAKDHPTTRLTVGTRKAPEPRRSAAEVAAAMEV